MKNRLMQSTALTVPADDDARSRRSWAPLQIGAAAMLALSLVATPLTFDGSLTLTDSAAKAEGNRGDDPFLRGQNRNTGERGDWFNNKEGGDEGGENTRFNEQGEGNDEFGDLGGDTELGEVGEEGGEDGWWPFN